jgi:heptosyltransferase-2
MPPRRIFVRAPNWVGDFVMATASFERLRRGFPDAEIVCGLRPYLGELAAGTDWFDAILDMPGAGGLAGFWRRVRAVRRRRFDLAVVLPNSLETGLVPFLARVPRRLGYRQGRPGLMTDGLVAPRGRGRFSRRGPRREPEPMPIYYAKLLDLLALPPGRDRGVLAVTDGERAEVDAWLRERGLDDGRRLVLLTAGASYGASKLWVPERFAAVARHFATRPDTAPVFVAGPSEAEMARELAADSGAVAAVDPVLPLGALKALVSRASLMITNDTGPRHIAVAFEKPVVCLMGPTDPRYTSYGLDRTVLINKHLECAPCQRKVCPLGHHRCMRDITVEEVLGAAEGLLAVPG